MASRIPLAIADFETSLAGAITVGATSFSLKSATDDDGIALPAGKYVFTVNNGQSNKQYLLGQLNGTDVTSVVTVSRQGAETSGAEYSARAGSPIIISDFATIQRVADILRGVLDLDGSSPLSYDTEPSLSNREELATVGYVLDTVTGGTVTFDQQVISGNGGEAIVAGNLVYFKTSDQEWYKTDADTSATVEGVQLGIALGTGSDGAGISGGVQIGGTWTTTGLTAGATYYASNTAGGISTSAGTNARVVGVALSTTKLLIIPRTPQDIKDSQKDAMAGGGDLGTPSTSNKFATEELITSLNIGGYAAGVTTSATSVIAHGLGYTPSRIKLTSTCTQGTGNQKGISFSTGVYSGATTKTVWGAQVSSDGSSSSESQYAEGGTTETYIVYLYNPESGAYRRATVAVDGTNITLTWSTSGSSVGDAQVLWEAFA